MKKFLIFLLFTSMGVFSGFSQNCDDADIDYLSENLDLVTSLAASCSTECLADPDLEGCVQSCIQENTPLSVTCAGCFGEQVTCAVENCFLICFTGSEAECADCVASNCLDDFNECAGIVDADNDSFNILFDCDDTNPNVYPDAPGTGEGIDNDCNGTIDPDEAAPDLCAGDLDENGFITIIDLSLLLTDYGCVSEDCFADVDGNPGTTATDLAALLSIFGDPCFE